MKNVLSSIGKILPSLLTILGTFFVGKNFLGATINDSLWQDIGSVVMLLAGVVYSVFVDHSATVEQIQAFIRRAGEVLATLLLASGKQMSGTLQAILQIALIATPIIYAYFSQKKTQALARGDLSPEDLKGGSK